MPHKALKALPAFKTDAEERAFWKTHNATDYLVLSTAQSALPTSYEHAQQCLPYGRLL